MRGCRRRGDTCSRHRAQSWPLLRCDWRCVVGRLQHPTPSCSPMGMAPTQMWAAISLKAGGGLADTGKACRSPTSGAGRWTRQCGGSDDGMDACARLVPLGFQARRRGRQACPHLSEEALRRSRLHQSRPQLRGPARGSGPTRQVSARGRQHPGHRVARRSLGRVAVRRPARAGVPTGRWASGST